MLMAVGRSAPRYQLMGVIYPKSKPLQSYMLEYFIILVRLCHHILQVAQKSAIGKWASSLMDPLDTYQSELDIWATSIKEEVDLLTAKHLSLAVSQSSLFRSSVSLHTDSRIHAKRVKARKRILDACSMYDHERDWRQIRKLGNSNLMNGSATYTKWKEQSQFNTAKSRTLVCTGKLGSGKSVLLANIIDDLNLDASQKTMVVYFFCQHDEAESLTARTVIGSLARQMLQSGMGLGNASEFLDERDSLSLDRVVELLQNSLPDFQAYFVLDGLMHCDPTEQRLILEKLRLLQDSKSLAVCISHRKESSSPQKALGRLMNMTVFPIGDQNPEIDCFIETELERCINSGELVVNDPLLVDEIGRRLAEGAQGMFLWVALEIKALCLQQTDADIRIAIANLPRDLSAIYHLILQKSQPVSYQRSILGLVMTARRPLTTEEMREALSVIPGKTVWDPQRLLNDVRKALACCGGLVTINEEDFSIRMIHHSVRTFLCTGQATDQFDLGRANREMAEIIVTYLNYEIFSKQISTVKAPRISANSVASSVISSAVPHKIPFGLLRRRDLVDIDIGHTLLGTMGQSKHVVLMPLEFYQYATSWWQEHICFLNLLIPHMEVLLGKFLQTQDVDKVDSCGRTPLSHASEYGSYDIVACLLAHDASDLADNVGRTALHWAVRGKNKPVVEALISSGKVNPNAEDDWRQTPTVVAIQSKDKPVFECLLRCVRVPRDYRDKRGKSFLNIAAAEGFREGVATLLDSDEAVLEDGDADGNTPIHAAAENGQATILADILAFIETSSQKANLRNRWGHTPFWLAAANGHEATVRILMNYRLIYHSSYNTVNDDPFWIAAANGHLGVIKTFLEFGIVGERSKSPASSAVEMAAQNGHACVVSLLSLETNVTVGQLHRSLFRAAAEGHESVVRTLAGNHAIDINCRYDEGLTPLWIAASKGHEGIVRALTETPGIEMNNRSDERLTPLWIAAARGHEGAVRALIGIPGMDPNSSNHECLTPLSIAAARGHEGVVNALVVIPGLDVNSQDGNGLTPLSVAASMNERGIVCTLSSQNGIDINLPDREGRTALWIAASKGYEDVVCTLASHEDIDLNYHNKSVVTPLAIAAENGHADIVSFLARTPGVDLNCADIFGMTPLVKAAGNGHGGAAKLLLSYAYPTPKDLSDGFLDSWAAFEYAVKAGHLSVVGAFLDFPGFARLLSDSAWLWALREANRLKYREIFNVLRTNTPSSAVEKWITDGMKETGMIETGMI
ncbi:uncharacterized protein APUU_61294S [Aspergillus puulaauensis]|uniref:NACHT domain-containing protein n=1 Tax=Aspergillus puulaauensis TaxID=1220207 RepID=A0A7R7XUZ6_9EURO|nr:uncharacterized protein APUU_61294S [Aspergillus puulaauensis]BCS28246.1 hypothetical protein APUU_61294S [Aspergillus puulaauensis]